VKNIHSILLGIFTLFLFIPSIQAADKPDHPQLLAKHYQLMKPDGTPPFPAVMMISGCSGFHADYVKGYYDSVQNRLVELGFVTLRVDSLVARNAPTCTDGVTTQDGADDIRIAADYLRRQPFVKKEAINVLGGSWGGAVALQALAHTGGREPVQVAAVVAYNPCCNLVRQRLKAKVPVLILTGLLDNICPFRHCKGLFGDMPVTVREYEDAHHGFANSELPAEKAHMFGTIGYNEAAAKAAWQEVIHFLKK